MKRVEGGLGGLENAFYADDGAPAVVEKISKRRRFEDEAPNKRERRRRPSPVETTPPQSAPPPATPVVVRQTTVAKPAVTPEKKEDIVNKPATVTVKTFADAKVILQAQDSMETCPLCGYRKPKEITVRNRDGAESRVRPIVCKGCSDRYHQYGGEVATKLAKLAPGETIEILERHAWILSQLDLVRFSQELNEAFQEKERLNGIVQEKIQAQEKLQAQGRLPRVVFMPLRDRLQQETGASAAYGKWRRMQARLQAATAVRPEVERMVADEAAKNSAKAAAKTEAPAQTAEADETTAPGLTETKEEPPATKPAVRKKKAATKKAAK